MKAFCRMPDESCPVISHQQFLRLFLGAERELLRYVMSIVPDPHDARDVLQDAAVTLWENVEKYDPAKPFVPWACGFALNAALHFLRSERSRRRLLDGYTAELLANRRTELASELDHRRERLHDCLKRLPPDQHALVRGYYFDDQPVESLARRQQRTVEAVYKALQRIRQTLLACVDAKSTPEVSRT